MQEDLISVIVPVYNVERYLSACLDSILSQSYKNLEIILVNDGSTDFSLKIAEKYAEKDDRVKLYSQENKGQSAARNKGISVATGKYLTFVDADDLLMPDSLNILIHKIKSLNVDIIEGKVLKGKIFKPIELKNKIKVKIFKSDLAIEKVLYQKDLLPSLYGKLYKSSLLENIRFTEGIIYEDLDIFYKIFDKADRIALISLPVYFYRNVENSTINSWKPKRLDVLKVTEELENYIETKYPDILPAAKDRRLSANFNMFALCSIHGEKDNAGKCWEIIKKYRKNSFFNSKVRFKNKAGITLSYFGRPIFQTFSKIIYK
ncbi:MAG: glycosyltransferase [Muribaculaceae bacterium]|nr:glycosyltransferase [Muribaculaceae bacterium]